jgi:hypothetical protein
MHTWFANHQRKTFAATVLFCSSILLFGHSPGYAEPVDDIVVGAYYYVKGFLRTPKFK